MNPVEVHLALNHVPLFAAALGLALFAYAAWRGHEAYGRLALLLFVGAALAALPVYFTGGEVEELVERLPGVLEWGIEAHEEAAKAAFAALEMLGVLAAALLFWGRGGRRLPGWSLASLAVVALLATGMVARAAALGGRIRHTELRTGFLGADAGQSAERD